MFHPLEIYEFGSQSSPSVLFVAGQHGREFTPIFVAHHLLEHLQHTPLQQGRVGIVPLVNFQGVAAGMRENPIDGKDLNRCYQARPGNTSSDLLAFEVLQLAQSYNMVVDLHAAGRARYFSHVIIHREEDLPLAAEFGLNFILKREQSDHSSGYGLSSYLALHGKPAVTLELGAGEIVRKSDISEGVHALKRFLVQRRILPSGNAQQEILTQQQEQVQFSLDNLRKIVKADDDMIICWNIALGVWVQQGEVLGDFIGLNAPGDIIRPIIAPVSGRLIYLRDRSLVQKSETLCMILSDAEAVLG